MIAARIEFDGLKQLEEKLGSVEKKGPSIVKKAVNDTAKKATKRLAKRAKDTYTVKRGAFVSAMNVRGATVKNLTATIEGAGRALSLTRFSYKKSKEDGVSAQVLKTGTMKNLVRKQNNEKAFVIRFESGHVAVAQRRIGQRYKSKGASERIAKYGKNADLTRIKVLSAPSLPNMINSKRVVGEEKDKILLDLKETLAKHMEEFVKG
ncbi:MAG: phage tail protein [Roseburia sp.]